MRVHHGLTTQLTALLLLAHPALAQVGLDYVTNVVPRVAAPKAFASVSSADSAATTQGATPSSPFRDDVLVLYTEKTIARFGTEAATRSLIVSTVNNVNTIYANSGVYGRLNLVDMLRSPVQESGVDMPTTLTNLRQNATVRALRDFYQADFVVLVSTGDAGGWCGYTYYWFVNGVNTDAYSVVGSGCMGTDVSFAHEIGHLQGISHDIETDPTSTPPLPYGRGYRVCVTGGFRTVMAYQCTNGVSVPHISYFSSPTRLYNNTYPEGDAATADATRAINDWSDTHSTYRTPTVNRPRAPALLAVTSQ